MKGPGPAACQAVSGCGVLEQCTQFWLTGSLVVALLLTWALCAQTQYCLPQPCWGCDVCRSICGVQLCAPPLSEFKNSPRSAHLCAFSTRCTSLSFIGMWDCFVRSALCAGQVWCMITMCPYELLWLHIEPRVISSITFTLWPSRMLPFPPPAPTPRRTPGLHRIQSVTRLCQFLTMSPTSPTL